MHIKNLRNKIIHTIFFANIKIFTLLHRRWIALQSKISKLLCWVSYEALP